MEVFLKCGKNPFLSGSAAKLGFRLARSLSSTLAKHSAADFIRNSHTSDFCSKCVSQKKSDHVHVLSHHRRRLELQAVSALLKRSGIYSSDDLNRLFVSGRHFSTSSSWSSQHDWGRDDEDGEKKDKDEKKKFSGLVNWVLAVLVLGNIILHLVSRGDNPDFISWNDFYHNILAKGEVEEITVYPVDEVARVWLMEGAVIKGERVRSQSYLLKIPEVNTFEEKVRKAENDLGLRPDQGVPIRYRRNNSFILQILSVGLLAVLGFWLLRSVSTKINTTELFAKERKANFMRVDVASKQGQGISFKDVAGLTEAKIEIMEFVDYLKTPQRFKELGAKIPRGALLLGPPGCGKTLLARAVATEAKVPFLAMAGSEFVEMIGGLGAARVRDLFKEARKRAPCIVYIDEIDAIGRKRTGGSFGSNMEEEHTLNQLLVEMDGIGTQEGVIMLAATNRADILDKALLRPGRFDRHIMIDLPTLIERRETFNLYLSKLKLVNPPQTYSEKMAQMTPGMSGADISNICNEAAIHAAREGKTIIDASDFEYAIERVIAGVEKKTRLLAPTEKKVVAYHESGHALVGWMLKYTDALLRISIVPRTNSALGFAQYMPSDQKLYSNEELFERMCMALGGRAAESVIFNHITTGAQDDLKKVTQMAYDQIRLYGMNDTIGMLSFPTDAESSFTKPYSRKLQATIDEQAQVLVAKAFQHTVKVLQDNKDKLHKLATSLLDKEVMSYEDVEALIGPPPHGKKNKIEPHGWEGIMPSNDTPKSPQPQTPDPNTS